MAKKKTQAASRSAGSGKFVTPGYARKHPSTTVNERNPVGKKPRKKK